jgi:hypothetical protein
MLICSPFSYVNIIIPTTRILLLLLSEIETDLIYMYSIHVSLFFPSFLSMKYELGVHCTYPCREG